MTRSTRGKKIRTLTNVAARNNPSEELIQLLTEIFMEVNHHYPNLEEVRGLKKAVEWMKEDQLMYPWSVIEGGLRDQTWDVAAGPA